jgi:hypothetical protein
MMKAAAVSLWTRLPFHLFSNPSKYDGSHVEVSGRVSNLILHVVVGPSRFEGPPLNNPYQEKNPWHDGSGIGTFATLSLCASQCVHVYAIGSTTIKNGETISVHGTFFAVKQTSKDNTLHNVIYVDGGYLP